ncbi:MAG: hypothetical protein WB297_04075 [Actinomycetota bacterium]
MTEHRAGLLGRYGRSLLGGAALLLLLALVASVFLSGSSVGGAERDATARAESLSASVIEDQLTSDLLTRDITGTAYRNLTVRIQAGILSDDRFTVVRVWRIDGALIYSTAQKDDTSVIAGGDRWIEQALGGQTVSVLSSTGTYHDGLKRPNEELFQTFVPIRLSSDAQVDAVAEIDQRYSAIHNEAFKIWRPVQLLVLLLLVGVGALFVRWVRNAPAPQELGPPPERRLGPGRRADDLNARDAAARADRAERLAEGSRKRLEELEATVAARPSTATANAALEELDLKLRASEAECEELAGTVRRIQATLAEKEAELALAREGSEGTRAETKRANKLIAEAESRVTAAEKKAAAAEKKAEDAGKRATVTAERALEMEAQLSEAEQRATDAQAKASIENARRADVVELQRAQEQFANTQVELSNAARKLREAEAPVEELERAGRSRPVRSDEAEGEPAPVPGYVTGLDRDPWAAETSDEVPSLGAFGDGGSPHGWETTGSDPEPVAEEEPGSEGLSLRERLARAAAAGRRLS